MFYRIGFVLLIIASLLAACAAPTAVNSTAPQVAPLAPQEKVFQGGAGGAVQPGLADSASNGYSAQTNAPPSGSTGAANPDRLVIKNASISLYVDDPSISAQRIGKMAENMEGFVVSANVVQTVLSSGMQVPYATVSIRVPAARLDEAMSTIRAETKLPVISENINSQDVTSEYTDLQSRLRNLEAAEAQLQKIMDSATKTEDVLAVYNQLVSTREQIEVIKGQMKYYEESAALSMISVDLTANAAVQPVTAGGWQPVGVARDALQALVNTLQSLVNVLIVIGVYLVPLVLILFVPLVIIFLIIRAALRRRKAKVSVAEE